MKNTLDLDKETINNLKLQCSQATKKEKKELILSMCSIGLTAKEISKISGVSVKSAKGYIDFYIANGGEVNDRLEGSLFEDEEEVETLEESGDNLDEVETTQKVLVVEDVSLLDFSDEIEVYNDMVYSGLDFLNYLVYEDILMELSAYDKAIQLLKHRLEDKLSLEQIHEISLAIYKAQNKRRAVKHLNDLRSVLNSKIDAKMREKLIEVLNILNRVSGEVVQNHIIYDNYSVQVKKSTTKEQREIISELVNGVADIKFEP